MSLKYFFEKNLQHSNEMDSDKKARDASEYDDKVQAMRWVSYGIELSGVVSLFSYGGYWADQKLHHEWPWLMMTLGFLAIVGMLVQLFKETNIWPK